MRSVLNFRLHSAVLLATWAVASLGCSSESNSEDDGSQSCETGTERCDCYRNDSCDDGLMCVSDVCVKDPAADDDGDAGNNSSNEDDAPGADPDDNDGAEDPDESEEDPTEVVEDSDESEEDVTEDPTESEEDPTEAEADPNESDASTASDDEEVTEATDETSDEQTEQAPEQQELEDGSVGSACGECDGDLVCVADVPGGYCTTQCSTNADCGADGACVENVCYRACGDDTDCRPSYACMNAGDVSVCDVGESTGPGSEGEAGNCANTCEHYLTCKGISDSETQQTCEGNCESSGYAADDLAAFQTTDCETAIYMVEGPASSEGSGGNGGGAVDCDGCHWDGSSCVYLSQYTLISTGGITCDASCCN